MIQAVNMQNVNSSATNAKSSSQTQQDKDGFRSALQSAVQKSDDSKVEKKTDSTKTKKQTGKTDDSSSVQANTGQAQQTVSVSPNEAALVASDKVQQVLPTVSSETKQSSDTSQTEQNTEIKALGTQNSVQIQPELSAASNSAAETAASNSAAETASVSSLGEKQEPTGPVEASQQQTVASETSQNVPVQNAQQSGSNSGQQTGNQMNFNQQTDTTQTAANQNVESSQSISESSGKMVFARSENTATQDSAKTQTVDVQAQSADTKSSDTDSQSATNNSLSNLYGNGNVVIKVTGETAQTDASPVQQVANAVTDQIQNGKSEFKIDLYPESLGKVSVKLTSINGQLTVELSASNPKTQSLLASGSADIRSILQASTGQNVQTVVPNQQTAQWYGQPQDGGGGNSGNQRQKKEESHENTAEGINSVSSGMNTSDFLAMIQEISAYAR